jgi:N-acetylmuramoyl-L-alanine amidase
MTVPSSAGLRNDFGSVILSTRFYGFASFCLAVIIGITIYLAIGGKTGLLTPSSPSVSSNSTQTSTPAPGNPALTPTPQSQATASPAPSAPRQRIVALDPGHGGEDYGTPERIELNGELVKEKELDLIIAKLVAGELEKRGYKPILLRTSDELPNTPPADLNGDGEVSGADDMQVRIDRANAADADVLVSIHLNAFEDSSASGTETFYCDERPFAEKNLFLAHSIHDSIISALTSHGYAVVDRGIGIDSAGEDPRHLFMLGPQTEKCLRPSNMPGTLVEALYLTNPADAEILKHQESLGWLAAGMADGIERYFQDAK